MVVVLQIQTFPSSVLFTDEAVYMGWNKLYISLYYFTPFAISMNRQRKIYMQLLRHFTNGGSLLTSGPTLFGLSYWCPMYSRISLGV